MKILHILRSVPDETGKLFIEKMSKEKETTMVPLYQGKVDYDSLLAAIFNSSKVISWW